MPSNKERHRQYRENHGEEYREIKRLQMQQKRNALTEAEKEAERAKARERMRTKRLKVTEDDEIPQQGFLTPQSLGKAVSKAARSLPTHSSRRVAVLEELCARDNLKIVYRSPPQFIGSQSRDVVYSVVENFYVRDDVSVQAPGLKETVYVKEIKTKVQKRYMLMSVREAYELFRLEFGSEHIKRSLFYELRPPHVLLISKLPHNVCVCIYHANIYYLIDGLSGIVPNINITSLIDAVVCNSNSILCMTGDCKSCDIQARFDNQVEVWRSHLTEEELSADQRYNQWINTGKEVCYGNFNQIVDLLKCKLVHFCQHTFIKRQQSECFKKSKCETRKLTIQVDFSENFTFKCQDEVQAMHWINEQLTVFTCVSWGEDVQSFAVISDDLRHDKDEVLIFLESILHEIDAFGNQYDEIVIFSDGAASQFKNQYIVAAMKFISKKYQKVFRWEYFATSHGKGAVDGIGGQVKRVVWDSVRAKKTNVSTLDDFVTCLVSKQIKVKVISMPKSQMEAKRDLVSQWYADAVKVAGITLLHSFIFHPNGLVQSGKCHTAEKSILFFPLEEVETLEHISMPQQSLAAWSNGDWTAVLFQDDWYPGCVESVAGTTLKIKFMKRKALNQFVWPSKDDCQEIEAKNILSKINAPTLCSFSTTRNCIFRLSSDDIIHVNSMVMSMK